MKSSTTLAALITHCRKLVRPQPTTDAELLRRFVQQREAAAFEQLVECYAPLVWGVCRRILPGEADCEDAFQAAFLSLVRQASSIDPNRPLGAWLHTIAVRTAAKARSRLRRQPAQTIVPEQTTCGDIADELANRELFRIVDEEIARLPALLREPFVLCCLQGRTRDEAAAALRCSVAAVKSRLERSRNLLRKRLERRGIGLPAAFLVLGLTGGHVRASLRAKALQCAIGSAPSAVAALVPTVGASLTSKLTLTAMSLVVVSALGFGALHVMQAEPPQEALPQAKSDTSQSPAAEKSSPRLDRFGDPLPPGAIHRFGTLRFRHDSVYDLAFTPDGKQLIAGVGTAPLSVFDAMTGRRLREVGKTSSNNHAGFALSPDGKRVACCGSDVSVWDLETGRLIRELGCGRCQSVAFSPDGKKVAAIKEMRAEILLVDLATRKHLAQRTLKEGKPLQYDFRSLAFSPDGKLLAGLFSELREEKPFVYTSFKSQIWLLDAEKGELVRTLGPADAPIGDFAFQPGSGRLATVGKDDFVRFWDLATGKEVHHIRGAKGAGWNILRFSADGRRCAVVNNESDTLTVLDAKSGRELRRIEIGQRSIYKTALALSPDGEAVALGKLYRQSCVRVWDVTTGSERLANAGHRAVATLSLSLDGRTLTSRDTDGQVIQWDTETGEQRGRTTETREETDRRFPAQWTGGEWKLLGPRWKLTYDYKTSMLEARSLDGSKLIGQTSWPAMPLLVLSPDGTQVAGEIRGRKNQVLLWNPEKEKEPRKLGEHEQIWQQLLFSHDGKRLITGAGTHNHHSSSTVWIWDVATARLVHKLATNSAAGIMLLTADDRVLFTGGLWNDATVHAWDMATGRELAVLADPSLKHTTEEQGGQSQLAITGLALSPDERFLAVISSRNNTSSVSIWETSSWKLVRAFAPTTPRNHAQSMLFSRDGRSLFVANSDSTILEWDVAGRSANRWQTDKSLNSDRLNVLWRTMIETPDKAYPAVWEMFDHPAEAVPFLIGKTAPVQPVDKKRVRQLLARLDSESFAEREEAGRQLLAPGEQVVPLLRKALKDGLSLEAKKRAEGVIESLSSNISAEQLRLLRALAVLEWSNRSEAVEHLRRMAGGAPSAMLTQAARAALQRLKR